MDAACPSPDFMAVEYTLAAHLTGAAPGPEWVPVECASKEAYGCGDLGEKQFLQGLTLHVRRLERADLINTSLSIALTDEAVRSIQSELGLPLRLQGVDGLVPDVQGSVKVADAGVLVICVYFNIWDFGNSTYYLVYDAADASLYMIPFIPARVVETIYTVTPVPARAAAGQGHELALVAQKLWPQPERGRLCVCTPATRAAASHADPDDDDGPWEIKVHRGFPDFPQAFVVDLVFSCEGKAFWADLSRGVAYSDLRQDGPAVDAAFVALPDGYEIDYRSLPEDVWIDTAKVSRTMGCVQGSVKFVSIDPGVTTRRRPPGNANATVIKVWTLDLDRRRWEEEEGSTCAWGELWTKACAMDARLRDVQPLEPQYPVLMPDGALCLLLPKTRHRRRGPRVKKPDYICSFDMLSKSCLCFRQVCNYHIVDPIILPYDFFKNCYPAPKRKPPTRKRKIQSISTQMPT
ncbi:unnamed protein product [Urochloa decumbens]|uniref:DUF1618 domain-containing protein n=1 Tax=Urochloa decumbens TaxID=240449 RepID=A0ABC8YMN7_9POAL